MTTTTSIRAIQATTNIEEAKEICRDMRLTAISVSNKYGADHPTARLFSSDYDNAVDEMAYIYGNIIKAS